MTTRRRRNTRQVIAEFYDDILFKWDYHGKYIAGSLLGGFFLGVLACSIIAGIVAGM